MLAHDFLLLWTEVWTTKLILGFWNKGVHLQSGKVLAMSFRTFSWAWIEAWKQLSRTPPELTSPCLVLHHPSKPVYRGCSVSAAGTRGVTWRLHSHVLCWATLRRKLIKAVGAASMSKVLLISSRNSCMIYQSPLLHHLSLLHLSSEKSWKVTAVDIPSPVSVPTPAPCPVYALPSTCLGSHVEHHLSK